MKVRLKPLASDIFISVYVVISLFLRFLLETKTQISAANSIVIGLCFVVILWVLIQLKFLNPNWFGLFTPKDQKNKN